MLTRKEEHSKLDEQIIPGETFSKTHVQGFQNSHDDPLLRLRALQDKCNIMLNRLKSFYVFFHIGVRVSHSVSFGELAELNNSQRLFRLSSHKLLPANQ